MEEINQNSQTSLDFNTEKFEPKNEIEIQQIIKFHLFMHPRLLFMEKEKRLLSNQSMNPISIIMQNLN